MSHKSLGTFHLRYDGSAIPAQELANANRLLEGRGCRILVQGAGIEIEAKRSASIALFMRLGRHSIEISNSLRRFGAVDLSPAAVSSIIEYGAITPGVEIGQGIERVVPGLISTYRVGSERVETRIMASGRGFSLRTESNERGLIEELERVLDSNLLRETEHKRPIVLFSGGVDSGLIAARLATLGRRDTILLNCAFSEADTESVVAERMARALGLEFRRVNISPAELARSFQWAYRFSNVPFSDQSIVATRLICSRALELGYEDVVLLDGTGADGGFGMFGTLKRWEIINSLPAVVKSLASNRYASQKLWLTVSSVERFFRAMRRCSMFPVPANILSQNGLNEILFKIPREIREANGCRLVSWLEQVCRVDSRSAQAIVGDVVFIGANIFAQKSAQYADFYGADVAFPFLDCELLEMAEDIFMHRKWRTLASGKRLLKVALAKCVPPEMVYRKKSSFVPPFELLMSERDFVSAVREALSDCPALKEFVDETEWCTLVDRISVGRSMPAQTINAIFSVLALSRWFVEQRGELNASAS